MTSLNPSRSMLFYKNRLETFKSWVYKDDSTSKCTPHRMAKAGFFCLPSFAEIGAAKCFVCMKVLDSWEQDDDPLEEHRKHAPYCPYIKLGKEDEESFTINELVNLCENMDINVMAELYEEDRRKLQELKEKMIDDLKKSERRQKK